LIIETFGFIEKVIKKKTIGIINPTISKFGYQLQLSIRTLISD